MINSIGKCLSIFALTFLGLTSLAFAVDLATEIHQNAPSLPLILIQKSLSYMTAHSGSFKNQEYMGIVNYDQPSTQRRFYVINLRTTAVEKHLVAHGNRSSDPNNRAKAIRFSNRVGSDMSSLGFFRTFSKGELNSLGEPGVYFEKGHLRTRLRGLQSTNNNVEKRAVVIHAASPIQHAWGYASYVSTAYINHHGYLGESEGCLALSPDIADETVQKLEGGALILTYSSIGTND